MAPEPSLTSWLDIAQRIGSGAAFVLGIGMLFLWRAYTAELTYSKSRDTQTLTVLLSLTSIVERQEENDKLLASRQETAHMALLAAINGLRELIINHYEHPRHRPESPR